MTLQDFSDNFTTLVNSHAYQAETGEQLSRADIAFDEYEKSMFLTKAQEEVALSLYTGRNVAGTSFEETEEMRRYLAPLIEEAILSPLSASEIEEASLKGIDSKSVFFELPNNPKLWFITYESVNLSAGKCPSHTDMQVIPITQDEYHRVKKNPFRGANDHRALRLDLGEGHIEVVCKYEVESYYLRYLKKLNPIITEFLGDLEIEGKQGPMECELHESLHRRILDRAVQLALQSRAVKSATSD
jgi:hypothetical protein